MKKEVLFKPHHLPVLWNDPSIVKADRLLFMFNYAKALESKNLAKSLSLYEKAMKQGCLPARLRLSRLYTEKDDKARAIDLLYGALESIDIGIQNLFLETN